MAEKRASIETKNLSVDVNSFVESFKRIHLLMALITGLACLSALAIYKEIKLREQLQVLDIVFTLSTVVSDGNLKRYNPLDGEKLVYSSDDYVAQLLVLSMSYKEVIKKIFISSRDMLDKGDEKLKEINQTNMLHARKAINNIRKDLAEANEEQLSRIKELKNSKSKLANSVYVENTNFFSNSGTPCDFAIIGNSKKDSWLINDVFSGERMFVNIKDIYLVNMPSRCFGGYDNARTALLIKDHMCNGKRCSPKWYIGLSNKDAKKLNAEDSSSFNKIKIEDLNLLDKYTETQRFFIKFDKEYVYYPIEYFDYLILGLAAEKTGKIYWGNQVDRAMPDLFESNKKETDFLGIKLDEFTFFRLTPLIFIVLIYEMYRRIQVLVRCYRMISIPWIFTNIQNRFDLIISFIMSLTPALFFVLILALYSDAQGMFLPISKGYGISLRSLLELKLIKMPPSGWYQTDIWSIFILAMVMAVLYFVFSIQKNLWIILFKR